MSRIEEVEEIFIEFLEQYDQEIKQLCYSHWHSIEAQDRLAEAYLAFCESYGSFPHDELFRERFLTVLSEHMKEKNKIESRERFHHSLNAAIKTKSGGTVTLTLLDILPADEEIIR